MERSCAARRSRICLSFRTVYEALGSGVQVSTSASGFSLSEERPTLETAGHEYYCTYLSFPLPLPSKNFDHASFCSGLLEDALVPPDGVE